MQNCPRKLDITPLAITSQYHTRRQQTTLQIFGIIQWVSYTLIQTLCLHLFAAKIDVKRKQIFSNRLSHSQYLQFSTLHVHTQFYITNFFFSPTWFEQHGLWRSFVHTQCFAFDKCMLILQLVIYNFFAIGCCECWPRSHRENFPCPVTRAPRNHTYKAEHRTK